ncbi:izumo sperm-egg fusion protein 1-like isoform X2 [Panthera pardus]|nr:izumo sperm-egg fusion protein 1-like isoform X2 [Panthera pardus]
MERIRETVRDFRDLPYLEDTFMGVIDEATMETSVLSFLRSVRLIRNSGVADDTFVNEFSWMLTLEKAAFQGYVARFQRKDFCPNKCGTMLQLLIWCSNCKKQLHACRKSRDCGVLQINVHETEDLILDCELDWHKLSQGLTYYSFYRVWGSNPETLVSEGKRPTLIKRLVRPEDAGNYRCELGTERSGPATVIHFEVTGQSWESTDVWDSGSWVWEAVSFSERPGGPNFLSGCGFRPRGCGFLPRVRPPLTVAWLQAVRGVLISWEARVLGKGGVDRACLGHDRPSQDCSFSLLCQCCPKESWRRSRNQTPGPSISGFDPSSRQSV